jgi:hypothetical protein
MYPLNRSYREHLLGLCASQLAPRARLEGAQLEPAEANPLQSCDFVPNRFEQSPHLPIPALAQFHGEM